MELFTIKQVEEAAQRPREGHAFPIRAQTLSPEQIEELAINAGYIPDHRRENAALARAFWRENWPRGFWPTVRVVARA